MKIKSFNDQVYLNSLNIALCNNAERVFDYFGLEVVNFTRYYSFKCPIHNGDNPGGITIFPNDEPYGCWQCNTGGCHKFFVRNMIGFICGIMSAKAGWTKENGNKANFGQVLETCKALVGHITPSIGFRNKLLNEVAKKSTKSGKIPRDQIRKRLKIPSPFFLDKFKAETLDHFDVGEPLNPHNEMKNRAIVPIYDKDYLFLGCQGRSLNGELPKWKNSSSLSGILGDILYNYEQAKPYIKASKTAILVEGPKDVWKLWESGCKNVVASLGPFKNGHKILLETSGAINIKCMFDLDDAGEEDFKTVQAKCKRLFHVSQIRYGEKGSGLDPADLTVEEIKNIMTKEKLYS